MNQYRIRKTVLLMLVTIAYILITAFGFLSGMFGEGLIGSTHPMAEVLADVIVWFGAVVGLAPAVCALSANIVREKPVLRRIILALPFILLAIQIGLGYIADML